jgi:hypothetical protein
MIEYFAKMRSWQDVTDLAKALLKKKEIQSCRIEFDHMQEMFILTVYRFS